MNFSTQVLVKCTKMGKNHQKIPLPSLSTSLYIYLLFTLLQRTNLIKIIKGKSFSRSIGNGTSSSITNYYESIHCEIDILFFYIFYIYLLGFLCACCCCCCCIIIFLLSCIYSTFPTLFSAEWLRVSEGEKVRDV